MAVACLLSNSLNDVANADMSVAHRHLSFLISLSLLLVYKVQGCQSKGPGFCVNSLDRGSIKLLRLFLEKGGNARTANDEGWTPLHLASRCGMTCVSCPQSH